MIISDILDQCREHGIKISLHEDKLRVVARKEIPETIKSLLKENRDYIIDFLGALDANKSGAAQIRKADRSSKLLLSFAQERLWFLNQFLGPSAIYNMPLALRLRGKVDEAALLRSLQSIVDRHESLRTRFEASDGTAVQVIDPISPLSLSTESVESEAQVESICRAERMYCFDLSTERLCRIRLLKQHTEYVLLVTMHHSISDGWSLGVFFRELVALYEAYANGEPSPLPALPIQYADFAQWQRQWLQGDVLERQLSYWRGQLAGLPPVLELPTDRPRPVQQTYRGATLHFATSKQLQDQLQELSRQAGVTMFMTLVSAFAVLLSRYAGQPDLAIGTPIVNRTRSETEGVIGFFVNSLVLRNNLSGDPSFLETLKRTREMVLQAYAHQDVPFENLVEALNPTRSLSHSPLFQVSFSLLNNPVDAAAARLSGAELTLVRFNSDDENGVARYDITFNMTETPNGIVGVMEYNTDIFDRATIARMQRHYENLLRAALADPQEKLSRLNFLDASERRQQLIEWNDTARSYPRNQCIHELFESHVATAPDSIALIHGDEHLTYGELNRRANQLAHYLRSVGVGVESSVGICVERSTKMIIGLLAILKSGGCYVPLELSFPSARLEHMLTECGCTVVLTEESLLAEFPFLSAYKTVPLDAEFLDLICGAQSNQNIDVRTIGLSPSHLAYVNYTSGSTGGPKGVLIDHRNIASLVATDSVVSIASTDTVAQVSNYAFDAITYELWGALANGAQLIIIDKQTMLSPAQLERVFADRGVSTMFLTTALFNRISHENPHSFTLLKKLLFGGEAYSADAIALALSAGGPRHLFHVYGPTECTTYATAFELQSAGFLATRRAPIGMPLPNNTAYVLNGYDLAPLGAIGELCIGGDGLSRGYLGRPSATAEKFIPDPFAAQPGSRLYRTGDVVRRPSDGNVDFVGRVDHQVKVRGFRIELGEIEAALSRHPAVREAVVLVREDDPGEKRLVAYLSVTEETSTDAPNEVQSSLREHLKSLLPEHAVPSAYVLLNALPLTENGKVDRKALPEPDESAYARAQYVAPRNAIEGALAELWQENLNIERVGVEDNYFAIGGDSIRSISLVAEGKNRGLVFSVKDLFSHPTIAQLATVATVTAEPATESTELEPFALLTAGERSALTARYGDTAVEDGFPLSMLQQGMLFHSLQDPHLGVYHDILTYRLSLAWEPSIFEEVLSYLLDRHQILRTVFCLDVGRPTQLVLRDAQPELAVQDIVDLDEASQDQAIKQWMEAEHARGLEPTKALWRMAVHVRSASEIQISTSFHHAMWDGWSNASFLTEFVTTYVTLQSGGHLPEAQRLPSYGQFVALEQAAESKEENRKYWVEKFAGAQAPWWSGVRRGASIKVTYEVPAEESQRVMALAARLEVHEKSIWCAAYVALISLLDGSDDVIGSIVTHGRPEIRGGEKMLGLFLNSLPVRVDMTAMRWVDVIAAVDSALETHHELRHFPLISVQVHTGLDFAASMFGFLNFHVYDDLGNAVVGGGEIAETNYPLVVSIHKGEAAQRHVFRVDLDAAVFDESIRERIGDYVAKILAELTTNAQARVDKEALLGREELERLSAWSAVGRAAARGLVELEGLLSRHPQVKEAAVVRNERSEEKQLTAYIVVNAQEPVAEEELASMLRRYIRTQPGSYLMPSQIVMLEAMPRTPNGQVDRRALSAPRRGEAHAYVAPEGVTEELLASCWGAVLQVDRVSREDNFFELGGHSLLATQLVSRIREAFGVELSIRKLFEQQTVRGQAQAIEAAKTGQQQSVVPLVKCSRDEALPLSFAQERLWFLGQYMGPNAVYNIPLALHLSGRVDEAALLRSLQTVIDRHESLRTHFEMLDGVAVQVIEPAESMRVQVESVGSNAELESICRAEHAYCFDLSQERLCRIRVLKKSELGTAEYVLLVTMHHSVSDGWSMAVFFRELVALYEAYAKGESSPLPVLPIQYADYAQWQRQWLQGEVLEQQLSYWRDQLAGLPPLLELPTDRPRPVEQTYRGATVPFATSKELQDHLQELSRQSGVTMFMTLLSAFAVLLSRYANQTDVAIGTPIANRTRTETESLIGFFVNTLVLRSDLSDEPRFVDLLKRTRETALQAYAHQDVPFEHLVEALNPDRSLSYSPLFQVSFSLLNNPPSTMSLSGVNVAPVQLQSEDGAGVARYDLTFNVYETEQGIVGEVEYHTDLFDRSRMQRLLEHYERLLRAIVARPEERVSRYDFLSEAEKHLQLIEWNATQRPYPQDLCVHELFETQARERPDAVALVHENRQLSYGELNRRANQLARYLRAQQVSAESRVGVCLERSPEMVIGILGILKAGAAYVPLDPSYPEARLSQMIEQSGCELILSESALLTELPFLSEHKSLPLDGELHEVLLGSYSTEDLGASGVSPENLAYVIYTSGSTGQPKGSGIIHRNITRLIYADYVQLSAQRSLLCAASPSFDAFTFELWGALLHGGRCVLADFKQLSFEQLGRLLKQEGVDCAWLTAGLFNQVVNESAELLSSVNELLVGGEALSVDHIGTALQSLPHTQLINGYGPTENTTFACTHRINAVSAGCSVPIGRPISNTQVYVLDGHGQLAAPGVLGELHIGGAGLSRGYINSARLTAEKFVPHPFSANGERLYRTGDLVRYAADGALEYVGRIDHQVKVRGFRIELGEIESVLTQHPQVRDAVVMAREDVPNHKQLVAYVVPNVGSRREPEKGATSLPAGAAQNAGAAQSAEAVQSADVPQSAHLEATLRAYAEEQLPSYMVPAAIVVLEALPLTSNGKVDRNALPAPGESAYARAQYVAPRNATEQALVEIWQQSLGIERVGIEDNYFAIGGDSIRSISLVAEGKSRGLMFSVKDLFSHPTIAQLATVASSAAEQAAELQEIEPFALLSAVERSEVLDRYGEAAVQDAFPLAMLQQGMLFDSMRSAHLSVYHDVMSYRVAVEWDSAVFAKALQYLISKHSILRTVFCLDIGRPLQLVLKEKEAAFEVVDAADLGDHEIAQKINAWMEQEKQRGIDTTQQPWRIVVHVLANQQIQFGMSFHHSLWDGWSVASFVTELFSAYASLQREVALGPVQSPPGYQHFIALEQAALSSRESREYWTGKLEGARLPWWSGQTKQGNVRFGLDVPEQSSQAIVALARTLGVQEKSVWCAAYLVLLNLLDGSNETVGSVVTHGRPELPGGEKMLGLFLTTLPLRIDISGARWVDVIAAVEAALQEQYAHRHYPLIEIQTQTGLDFVGALFNYVNFHVYGEIDREVEMGADAGFDENNFLFTLHVYKQAGAQRHALVVDADTAIFDQEFRERLTGYLERIVEELAAHSDARIRKSELLGSAELSRLLVEWNNTTQPFTQDRCIHELLQEQAQQHPERIALICQDLALSYRDLDERANRLAHLLAQQGVKPRGLVALCLDRSVEMVVAIYAVFKTGAAYLPLDPALPESRLTLILESARPQAIITQDRLSLTVAHDGCPTISIDAEETLALLRAANASPLESRVTASDVAYTIYTSGSTGVPKGVQIEHKSIVSFSQDMQQRLAQKYGERAARWGGNAAYSFDASLQGFGQIACGNTLVLIPESMRLDPAALLDYMREHRVDIMDCTPTQMAALLDVGTTALPDFIMGGEKVGKELWSRLIALRVQHGVTTFNVYGPTEATINATICEISESTPEESMGRYLSYMRGYVLHAGEVVPIGVAGELYLGGVGLARGYLGQPDMTAQRFVANPFSTDPKERLYRTGDIVRYRADGSLEFLGRTDEQVKIRGFRIELGDIEFALSQHPKIKDVVVIARDEGGTSQRKSLAAYVVLDSESDTDETVRELRAYLQERLPHYMVPSDIVALASIPRTTSGKTDRKSLPAPDRSGAGANSAAPEDPAEQLLASLWCAVLKLDRVGRDDNFFELGGHSLLATQLVSRIREAFSIEFPIVALFENQTVRSQAAAIARARRSGDQPVSIAPATRDRPLPLSFAQQGLWLASRLIGPTPVYNVPMAFRLQGRLDVDALRGALQTIVARHEALRTRFEVCDGSLVQVIAPSAELAVEVEPVTSVADCEAICRAERDYAFDLSKDALIRVRLLRESAESHVLLITMHHIASDGWSAGVFFRELVALYEAFAKREPSPLAPLPIQYADYALWQRTWLSGEVLEQQLGYWRNQLAGLPPVLNLPTDRPRPAERTFRGGGQRIALSADLLSQLQELSRQTGTTLFMTLLSGFAVLLSRYAAQTDVAIGTPIANRTRGETEGLIGFFVNTLVLRSDLSDEPRFVDFLKRTREVALQAYAHQDVPFEYLVEALNPERSLSHAPLFQVMFMLMNTPMDGVALRDIQIAPLEIDEPDDVVAARHDLWIGLTETPSGLVGEVRYNRDLFDASTIARLIDHYERLLCAIVADPRERVSRYQFLSEAEKHQQLTQWSEPALCAAPQRCVHELFEEQVRKTPDSVAVVYQEQCLTFAALNRRANQLARWLLGRGIAPETLVGLDTTPSLETVIGLLAILKAGGAYVPLNPSDPASRIRTIIEDSSMRLVLTSGKSELSALQGGPVELVSIAARRAEIADFASADLDAQALGLKPGNLAYVIHTSGSTGRPKGVMVEHRNIANYAQHCIEQFGLEEGAGSLVATTLSFDLALTGFYPPLLCGRPVHLLPEDRTLTHLKDELLKAQGISPLKLTPTHVAMLNDLLGDRELHDHVDTLVLGGELLRAELIEAWQRRAPRTKIFNHYGPTETTVGCLVHRVEGVVSGNVPVGRPISNAQAYVLDGRMQLLPVGCTGELWIGGAGVARGYLGQPALTAEKFAPNPFRRESAERLYRTGDLVRYLSDGQIEFLGRADEQVKVRGFRIELGEIEHAILEDARIERAVVIARVEDSGQKQLVAYVTTNANVSVDEIQARLRYQLPDYMSPAAIVVLDELPRTPNGKVDRKALPAPDRGVQKQEYAVPEGMTEELLATLWCAVLRVERVGREDNFFDLGGHSLFATQLVSRIREAFGVELPIRVVFEQQTLRGQARAIEEAKVDDQEEVAPLTKCSREVALRLSFSQERLWFLSQLMGPSAVYNMPLALHLSGEVDEPALLRSLQAIVDRHESLRTHFEMRDGAAVQIIEPTSAASFHVERVWSDQQVEEIVLEERAYCFDLSQERLCRVRILKKSELGDPTTREYALLVTMHHSISDGWSLGVFFRELVALYGAYAKGEASPLAALPIQYADYAQWQRGWLQGEVLSRQVDYWRAQLSGLPPLLELPTDRPRPAHQTYRGATLPFVAPKELHGQLQELSRQSGVTLFMTLLSAFSVLLSRYANQTDVAIGTPIANRTRSETEGLIGFFVNTLVLRNDLSDEPRFVDLLKRTREMTLQAYAHQHMPFEHLVEVLKHARTLSHSPLFQVMFALGNAPKDGTVSLPGVNVSSLRLSEEEGTGVARFDLTLSLSETPHGLIGGLEYNTDLFDRSTMQRLVEHYERLLQAIVAHPEERVTRYEFLSDVETHQQRIEWNATQMPYAQDRCIHELFEAQAEKTPDGIALVHEDHQLTYAQLNARANQIAHVLAAQGVGPEVRVGICVERSPSMLIGLLGILKAGGCYVPLDPAYPKARLAYLLADSGVGLVLTERAMHAQLRFDELAHEHRPLHKPLRTLCLDDEASWTTRAAENLCSDDLGTARDLSAAQDRNAAGNLSTATDLGAAEDRNIAGNLSAARDFGTDVDRNAVGNLSTATDLGAAEDRNVAGNLSAARDLGTDVDRNAARKLDTAKNLNTAVSAQNLAYVIYTSGSTGQPKGVGITHEGVISLLQWSREQVSAAECAGVLACTSICFDLSIYELFMPLSCGGTCVLVQNALALEHAQGRERVSLVNTVPSAAKALLERGAIPRDVQVINLAGEPLKASLVDALYEQTQVERIYDLYGPSEGTTYSTYTLRERNGIETIGRPLANTQAYVLDANGQLQGVGVVGELYLGGVGLARGYLDRSALTAQKFVPNPFGEPGERLYRTGDLVRHLADGNLEYIGRIDHQVKVRGFRIELGEIESVLSRHALVKDVVVMAREDVADQRQLVAYVVAHADEPRGPEETATSLRAHEMPETHAETPPQRSDAQGRDTLSADAMLGAEAPQRADAQSVGPLSAEAVPSADAASTDAGSAYALSADAASTDAASTDAGSAYALSADAASTDAGSAYALSADAASTDAGSAYALSADAASADAVSTDALSAAAVPAEARQRASVEATLRTHLQEQLPSHMVPAAIVVLETLPLTPNGKVDRKALPAPDRTSELRVYTPPQGETEELLARLWCDVLHVERVGRDDNFFELGGHSLLVMRLVSQISAAFSVDLSIWVVFEQQTLAEQARAIEANQAQTHSNSPVRHERIVAFHASDHEKRVFCISGAGGQPTQFRELAEALREEMSVYALKSDGSSQDGTFKSIAEDYAAIITAAYEPPYYLVGHSIGALIAYEMAELIGTERMQGLLFIDPPSPKRRVVSTPRDHTFYAAMVANNLVTTTGVKPHIEWSDLFGKPAREIDEFVAAAFSRENFVITADEVAAMTAETRTLGSMKFRRSGSLDVRDVQIVIANGATSSRRRELSATPRRYRDWADYFAGPLVFTRAKGSHFSLLNHGQVDAIADILRREI
jgi:amino acid adenylation domain-containing protein